MLKYIAGAAVIGVFFGAFSREIVDRVDPDLTKKIQDKARRTIDALDSMMRDLKTKCDVVVWGEEENS